MAWSCSTKVIHFVNEDADFESYSNYLILNFKVADRQFSKEGKALLTQLEEELRMEMSRRAYKEVNRVEPDLLLRYELIASTTTRTDVNQVPFSGFVRVDTQVFYESALLVELTDRRTKKLVWQGSADLKSYVKKNKETQILQAAVKNIFRTYPYLAEKATPDLTLSEK